MAWEPIRRIIPGAVKGLGIQEKVTSVLVLQRAADVLTIRWGVDAASRVTFVSFAGGVLKATTPSGPAMAMLKREEVAFMNMVNQRLGQRAVIRVDLRAQGF